MNELVNGRIPSNTVCPFRAQCMAAIRNQCKHFGTEHNVPFSCGYARWFALESKINK